MGEYARVTAGPTAGKEVKIGTCEDMYFLRRDQRHMVAYSFEPGDRFRFPFPDEDTLAPGAFENHDRGWPIWGWRIPDDWADGHGSVQFRADAGYLLSIPCPESLPEREDGRLVVAGLTVARNGWSGGPRIVQQREVEGHVATIVQCGACRHKWRLSPEAAEEVAMCLRSEADRKHYGMWHEIADRMLAGYLPHAIESDIAHA